MKHAPKNSTTAEFQIGVVLCETKTATDTSRLPRFPERPHLRRSVAKPTREPPHPTSRGSTLNKQGSLTSKFSAGQPTPVLKLQLAPAVATLRAAPRICVLDKPPRSLTTRQIGVWTSSSQIFNFWLIFLNFGCLRYTQDRACCCVTRRPAFPKRNLAR